MENQKENPAQENVAVEKKEVRKAYFPPYWEKRKKRLKKEFIQKLQDSANSEVIASDKFGEYRAGTFLHKAAIVSVQKENGMWKPPCSERGVYQLTPYRGDPLQVSAR